MLRGKIVFYDRDKRQGYVRLPETREEFHFRISVIDSDAGIDDKAWVQFRLQRDRRGYLAVDLQPLYLT
ncbi:hypothetical protein CEQ90_07360 [Lewinellaceae bacterium SD302]|nr:hypothetical protein CEQ90_07360 [Lewinellaceae bacterium SD302]